jgi:hypothetical protein
MDVTDRIDLERVHRIATSLGEEKQRRLFAPLSKELPKVQACLRVALGPA